MTSFAWGALFGAVAAVAISLAIFGCAAIASIAGAGALGVLWLARRGGHV